MGVDDGASAQTGVRVVLVAGDAFGCSGIRAMLGGDQRIRVVGEASRLGDVPRLVRELAPGVVVVDVAGLRIDASDIARRLAAAGGYRPVAWLYLLGDRERADLFVTKQVSAAIMRSHLDAVQLRSVIRLLASGYVLIGRDIAHRMVTDYADGELVRNATLEVLTTREREVFRLLAQGSTNADIAANLSVAKSTVKSHVENILKKLELRNRLEAVIYSYQVAEGGA